MLQVPVITTSKQYQSPPPSYQVTTNITFLAQFPKTPHGGIYDRERRKLTIFTLLSSLFVRYLKITTVSTFPSLNHFQTQFSLY